MESFSPGYRLQEGDLNMNFYAQGIAYPPELTYTYTPYYVSYEIDFIDPEDGLIPLGSRNRLPELVKPGTYRANLIIEDRWTPGLYQISWNYKVSGDSAVETTLDIFEVSNLGVHHVPFEIFFCEKDLSAVFVVLQDVQDLPASFAVIP